MDNKNQPSRIEELKKFKELLDMGVISQEEFEEKKKILLDDIDPNTHDTEGKQGKDRSAEKFRKLKEKGVLKKAVIMLLIITAAIVSYFAVSSIIEKRNTEKRTNAIEMAISDELNEYGLYTYTIEYSGYSTDIYLGGSWSLTKGDALVLLRALESKRDIEDPCGGEPLDVGDVRLHPSDDKNEYYYYVSWGQVWVHQEYGGTYDTVGLYYSVGNTCILEE